MQIYDFCYRRTAKGAFSWKRESSSGVTKPFPIPCNGKKVKNINVRVTPEGKVMVSAPKRIALATVEGFLLSKFDWLHYICGIKIKRNIIAALPPAVLLSFRPAVSFGYYGSGPSQRPFERRAVGCFCVKKEDSASIDQAVRNWYQQQALSLLPPDLYCRGRTLLFRRASYTTAFLLRQMSASFGNCNHTQNRIT